MLDIIKLRLQSLGYEVVEGDDFALNFVLKKVEEYIKHFCNIKEIPECLDCVIVDMVCGEFLQSKKSTGQLSEVKVEEIVKKIQDGDTTVEFATGKDAETIFDNYLEKLIKGKQSYLISHRRLVW